MPWWKTYPTWWFWELTKRLIIISYLKINCSSTTRTLAQRQTFIKLFAAWKASVPRMKLHGWRYEKTKPPQKPSNKQWMDSLHVGCSRSALKGLLKYFLFGVVEVVPSSRTVTACWSWWIVDKFCSKGNIQWLILDAPSLLLLCTWLVVPCTITEKHSGIQFPEKLHFCQTVGFIESKLSWLPSVEYIVNFLRFARIPHWNVKCCKASCRVCVFCGSIAYACERCYNVHLHMELNAIM